MHILVADPTDTFAAAHGSAITEGFPHHVALGKMASRLKYVYTLQRIAPILNETFTKLKIWVELLRWMGGAAEVDGWDC